jgi:hypothetical protein
VDIHRFLFALRRQLKELLRHILRVQASADWMTLEPEG